MASSPSGRAPHLGDQVGAYTIVRTLGAGGKAAVYLATRADGFSVALKILHPASLDNEDFRRFSREFDAVKGMNHPNVVKVMEAGTHGIYPWIALEYIEGQDLMSLIDAWKANPATHTFAQVEAIFRNLCAGLQYVHDRGLIHRDLKPNNVLITQDGVAKITDFGVVKDPHAMGTQLTVAGRLVGTVAFMAPEQIAGETLDHRADLYALGAVLYMLLTLRRPIEANSVAGYLARHLTEVPKAPSEIDPAVPRPLEAACQRLLLKDPAQRFASASAVLDALAVSPPTRLPLRGRERELARWGERLSALSEGAGGVMAWVGPARAGRTHLLHALEEVARGRDLRVGSAIATAPDPLRDLAVSAGLDGKPMAPEARLRALAQLATRAPLVLLLDDLDADEGSLAEQLARLVRDEITLGGAPLLLAFTARTLDGPLEALASGLLTDLPADVHALPPLSRDAIQRMVRDLGVGGALAPVLGRRLHDDLGGLPGLVTEHLGALEREGWLLRKAGALRGVRPVEDFRSAPLPVPAALRTEVQSELSSLSADALDLLTALVFLDRPAAADTLLQCAGLDDDARSALDELARLGCARVEAEEAERCALNNPLVSMVLREAIEPTQAALVHRKIAAALGGTRRRQTNPEVAHHLVLGGQPESAWPIYLAAARRALRANSSVEAAEYLERGAAAAPPPAEWELIGQPDEQLLWLYLLRGEALADRQKYEEALPYLRASVDLARGQGDDLALGRSLAALGQALYQFGARAEALSVLEETLANLEPGAPEWAPAARALADLLTRLGQFDRAIPHLRAAVERASAQSSPEAEGQAVLGLGRYATAKGDLAEADRWFKRGLDLAAAATHPALMAQMNAHILRLDLLRGRYAIGLDRAETLLDELHEREMTEPIAIVTAMQGAMLQRVGDPAAATIAARSALAWRVEGKDWRASLLVARTWCLLGQMEEARAALPDPSLLPDEPLTDPIGQRAVLEAWTLAEAHPLHARELTRWAMGRPSPAGVMEAAERAHLAAQVLLLAGDSTLALESAKVTLKRLGTEGAHGHRLEALLTLYRMVPDPRVIRAIFQLSSAIAKLLPADLSARFLSRPLLAEARAAAPTPSPTVP